MNATELKELVGEVVGNAIEEKLSHSEFKEMSDAFKASQLKQAELENNGESKKAVGAFLKGLLDGGDAFTKDLSISTDANGGYLVPTEFYKEFVEKRYKTAYLRRYATVLPMSSDKLEVQTEGNDVSVNWTTELATITQADPTFGQVILAVNTLAGISRMSRQLLADAAINEGVAELVIRKFGNKIGRTEDTAFMVGSGTGQPKGIRQYTISQSVAQVGASLVANDITALYHTLPEQYRQDAVWIMNDLILKLVRQLRSTTGEELFDDAYKGANGEYVGMLLGRPVISQNDIPMNLGGGTNESEIYFGDASYYYIGDRQEVAAEVSTQEGTSFEKHRAAVKVTERIDGQLTITEAFAKMTAVK